MAFTLTHRGAPVAWSITAETGKELLLSLMLTGADAKVGHKYRIGTNAPAGDITFDAEELEITTVSAGKAYLVWKAPTGFTSVGSFEVKIQRTNPPAPTPAITITVDVLAAPTPPATPPTTPPATPAAPATATGSVTVPISVVPPAPLTFSLTPATPPAAPAAPTPPAPTPVPKQMAGWVQSLIAVGALAVILIAMLVAWNLTVGTVINHSFTAAGAGLSVPASDPVVIHTTGLSATISADDLTVTSSDPTSATQILGAIQALGGTATVVPVSTPAATGGP